MILCDTGPIVATALRTDAHSHECTKLFTELHNMGRRLLIPATVIAEVGYLLENRSGPKAEAAFLRSLADGAFEPVSLQSPDFERMAELVHQYKDLPLGTTDASVIALAEKLGITQVATLDHRHFTVVRPRHVNSFALVPK